jgi:hypothetical protein
MFLLMDESGCLGFDFEKARTSKYFVITCLFSKSKRPLEKITKKIHQGLRQKFKRKTGVLHCSKESPVTRQRLLKLLRDRECVVMTVYLNKRKVFTRLQDEKHVLYNYVTNILLDRIFAKKIIADAQHVILIASKRETNRFLNENFSDYLNRQVDKVHGVSLKVEIKTPAEETSLQVVDFVSWAIFRKYEYGDESYYNMIRNKIIEENPLFP